MEAKPFNEQYETPVARVFVIEIESVICGSVYNGGIENGIPDEI